MNLENKSKIVINFFHKQINFYGKTIMRSIWNWYEKQTYEPSHDKNNKVTVRPAKTQISLDIRPVCSESLLCA